MPGALPGEGTTGRVGNVVLLQLQGERRIQSTLLVAAMVFTRAIVETKRTTSAGPPEVLTRFIVTIACMIFLDHANIPHPW